MKTLFYFFAQVCFCVWCISVQSQPKVNLTPLPKDITIGQGQFVFPKTVMISTHELSEDIQDEARKFATALNIATPMNVALSNGNDGVISLALDPSCATEGYKLDITSSAINIKASTATGFFYAFQSLKKMLPANVMAGVDDSNVADYSLPTLSIDDEPRFGYRGFMLDVSRHFFTVEEVKRMIDIMAAYKMNTFHWHLTDDQGWRVEIKKYPKLTSVGSIRSNSWTVDMDYGDYWTNSTYGPFFYTQEEIADVVDYCHQRHIKVIPEIDMPGHFVAALVSYPEYSCTPNADRSVWINGGISGDVLNVANPNAVQFTKDILSEIMDMFPDGYVHIGGDECPTSAWQNNAQCQELYAQLGLSNYRQLQSHFIKDLSDFVQARGYKMIMWNESITADGADLDLMKQTGATVMCWTPCQSAALKAANMGLNNIITEYHSASGGYYINRKQSNDSGEPTGAGAGDDTVEGCYNYVPVGGNVDASLLPFYSGVQGTFWTEHVANRKYMEYLALPRLMAIAETGWTPQAKKNFNDFRLRMMADTVMLNYNGYNYGRHAWRSLTTDTIMPKANSYYRIVTRSNDARKDRCIELLRPNSPLISENSDKGAQAYRLWTTTHAEEGNEAYRYQMWTFEPDPSGSGRFAIVCQAKPVGSVKPSPTANGVSGRWDYDVQNKHYSFVLGERAYGKENNNYYYTIRSSNTANLYMNASLAGQGFAVNLYNDPNSGNGGIWTLVASEQSDVPTNSFSQALWDSLPKLAENDTICIQCSVEGFDGIYMADRIGRPNLVKSTSQDSHTWWVVKNVTPMDSSYTQACTLYNPATRRYISGAASNRIDKFGFPVKMITTQSSAGTVGITYQPATHDYQVSLNGYNFYPVADDAPTLASTICSGSTVTPNSQAIRPQGAAWLVTIDNPTAVKGISALPQSNDKRIFNLNGQQVTSPTPSSIYIVNGHKIRM